MSLEAILPIRAFTAHRRGAALLTAPWLACGRTRASRSCRIADLGHRVLSVVEPFSRNPRQIGNRTTRVRGPSQTWTGMAAQGRPICVGSLWHSGPIDMDTARPFSGQLGSANMALAQ